MVHSPTVQRNRLPRLANFGLVLREATNDHEIIAPAETELRRRGVTLALLWEEYRAVHLDGFGYRWFGKHDAAFTAD